MMNFMGAIAMLVGLLATGIQFARSRSLVVPLALFFTGMFICLFSALAYYMWCRPLSAALGPVFMICGGICLVLAALAVTYRWLRPDQADEFMRRMSPKGPEEPRSVWRKVAVYFTIAGVALLAAGYVTLSDLSAAQILSCVTGSCVLLAIGLSIVRVVRPRKWIKEWYAWSISILIAVAVVFAVAAASVA